MAEVEFTTSGGLLVNQFSGSPYSQNPREQFNFSYQVNADNVSEPVAPWYNEPILYKISSGQLPNNLSINETTGLISGTVVELDSWVPSYVAEESTDPAIDGSNYASKGSARDSLYDASFVVRAYAQGYEPQAYADQSCTIRVVNDYSSDRDQMIRDYSDKFGNTFIVNGNVVDAETFLSYQKSLGYYI
jgi:hypothetical protein